MGSVVVVDIKGEGLTSEVGAIKGATVVGTKVVAGVDANGKPGILVSGGIAPSGAIVGMLLDMLLDAGVLAKGGRITVPANRFGADVVELKVG